MSGKSKFSRRGFLGAAATGAAALALGRHARAQSGGTTCSCGSANSGPKILEMFGYGGMSQWESLWLDGATPQTLNWREIGVIPAGEETNPNYVPATSPRLAGFWNGTQCASMLSTIGLTAAQSSIYPTAPDQTRRFANVGSKEVHWGPATKPLWGLLDGGLRARMVVMRHDLSPHEAAAPYVLTGSLLGSPFMAGTGSSITHDLRAQVGGALPLAYTFADPVLQSAALVGGNNAASRPLQVGRSDPDGFRAALQRSAEVAALDPKLEVYARVFRRRLRQHGGLGDTPPELVRSNAYGEYEAALVSGMGASPAFLPEAAPLLTTASAGCPIVDPSGAANVLASSTETAVRERLGRDRRNMRLAASLLRSHARYCLVHVGSSIGSFDTHGNAGGINDAAGLTLGHAVMSGYFNITATLRGMYDSGELCPTCTLVVLTTEFNRKPLPELVYPSRGRGHHPYGMVTLLLGGGNALPTGQTIHGDIGATGYAIDFEGLGPTNAADLRSGLLVYAGAEPFGSNPRRFTAANLSAGTNALVSENTNGASYENADLSAAVRQRILGT